MASSSVHTLFQEAVQKGQKGDFPGAEAQLDLVVAMIRDEPGGATSQEMGTALASLAWCYNEQSKHPQTEDAARRAIQLLERVDPNMDDVLTAIGRYIGALCMQGKYDQCAQECAKGIRRMAELENPGTGAQVLVGEMSHAYKAMGNLVQAETMARMELKLCDKMYGHESEYTAFAMYRLASCLIALEQQNPTLGEQPFYSEAKMLMQESLISLEKKFGKEHEAARQVRAKLVQLKEDHFSCESLGVFRCCG